MARINFDDMSVKELLKLQVELEAALAEKRVAEQRSLKEKIAALASSGGFTVEELFGAKRGVRAGTKIAPKYMNPDNPEETWTGRGRQPRWMAGAIKKHGKLERLLIK